MIEEKETLTGKIQQTQYLTGELDKIIEVIEPVTQGKETTPTKQTQVIIPDEGYTGLSSVVVNPIPPEYIIPSLGQKTIVNNGTYNASDEALDGYSSVSVNIEAGVTIDGKKINTQIQDTYINKGDFVKRGDFTINDKLSSSNNYALVASATITNEQNMFDDNENTYADISLPAGNPRIYLQCKSRQELNIPANALLKNVICNYKIGWSSIGSQYSRYAGPVTYTNGNISTRLTGVGETKTYPNISTQGVVDTITFYQSAIAADGDTDNYGFQVYSGNNINNRIHIYYANFDIYYEYESKVKKITDRSQIILGIANQNGNQGDTIEVFVPNVE